MSVLKNTPPIMPNEIYHVYNRANGNDRLFTSESDHYRFLSYIKSFIVPHAHIYAYCLIPNHFHYLLQVKDDAAKFSRSMANCSNAYAKYFNTKYNRRGGLFMKPFKRTLIENDASLAWITWYIHRNPLHHGLTKDWQNWMWSSYKAYTGDYKTLLATKFLLDFFGGRKQLTRLHHLNMRGWIDNDME